MILMQNSSVQQNFCFSLKNCFSKIKKCLGFKCGHLSHRSLGSSAFFQNQKLMVVQKTVFACQWFFKDFGFLKFFLFFENSNFGCFSNF
jgi:hypothetical protein